MKAKAINPKAPPLTPRRRHHPRQRLNPSELPESELFLAGFSRIAGVDEVGRGCLAGPVFAAAVIFPPNVFIEGVDDSKKLAPPFREALFPQIQEKAVAYCVASVSSEEIDEINIHRASLKAMALAVEGLSQKPEYLLIDGKFQIPLTLPLPQKPLVGGDGRSHAIAAASILAKVSRDRWMSELADRYPQFGFQRHKGYATEEHRKAIRKNGLTEIHRRSFCSKFMRF